MGSVRPYVPQPMGSVRPYVPQPNYCFPIVPVFFLFSLIFKDTQCDTDNKEKCDKKQRMRLFIYLLLLLLLTVTRTVTYLCLKKEGMRKCEYVLNSVRKEERNEIDMNET